MDSIRTVKITRKVGSSGRYSYSVSLPKDLLKEAGLLKTYKVREGDREIEKEELASDILIARVIEIKIDGKDVKGIFYYKP